MSMQDTQTLERVDLFAATQVNGAVAMPWTIAKGQKLKRGALITARGYHVDETNEVYGVLAEDTDTTEGAKSAPVYVSGEFNANALSTAASITVAEVVLCARKAGIYIK